MTRASNNYGPYQYPEKLIPLFVTNALEDRPLPLYGDGLNVRDWLYVEDHCERPGPHPPEGGALGRGVQHRGREHGAEHRASTALSFRSLRQGREALHRATSRTGPATTGATPSDTAKLGRLGWRPRSTVFRRTGRHRRLVSSEPMVVAAHQAPGPGVSGLLQGAVLRPQGDLMERKVLERVLVTGSRSVERNCVLWLSDLYGGHTRRTIVDWLLRQAQTASA